ncbi:hypothetical protein NKJ26_33220, partial [Mesorhizobium sp. M0152]|uniref:hypothetical protein n=1 Tax=Mesorhizobium sp. M0152 TaxID=2956898 RepID=UPI003335C0F4
MHAAGNAPPSPAEDWGNNPEVRDLQEGQMSKLALLEQQDDDPVLLLQAAPHLHTGALGRAGKWTCGMP